MNEGSFLNHFFIGTWDEDTTSLDQPLLSCGAGECQDSGVCVHIDTILHASWNSFIGLWHNSRRPNHHPLSTCPLINQTRVLVPLQDKLLMNALQFIKWTRKEELWTMDGPHDTRLTVLDKRVLQGLQQRLEFGDLNLLIGPWHIDGGSTQSLHGAVASVADSAVVLIFKHDFLRNKLNVLIGICKEECGSFHHTSCASSHMGDTCIVSLL
mmetsp:Transcript_65473/g.122148  ORF Transcript_65473/g.122148 Transcript_65473/m.122148 type:complete len:211 (+) Transcript_65473:1001-1633(+)